MKKIVSLTLCVFAASAFLAILYSQQYSYVGAEKCKICHKSEKQGRQYIIWEESKHSKSFANLSTDQALSVGKKAGVDNPSASPECLKCHGSLHKKAPEITAEGVSCEICHGPGSEYKKLSVMKNREEAVKNGLIIYESPEAIKTQCLGCHENAHGKSFDFKASWEKIKHPLPEE